MLCDLCKKNEAIVHYAEIVEGQMKKMNLCEACAVDKGVGIHSSFSIGDLLAGLTENPSKTKDPFEQETCPKCKMTYKEFKKKGRLGCSACYDTFQKALIPLLEAIHKNEQHAGKIPVKAQEESDAMSKLQRLKEELTAAIRKEDFERAARLRDEIRRVEQSGEGA